MEGDLRLPLLPEEGGVAPSASFSSLLSSDDAPAPPLAAPPRVPNPLRYTAPFILTAEFAERLAYYGLATNLVNFFTERLQWGKADAAAAVQARLCGPPGH